MITVYDIIYIHSSLYGYIDSKGGGGRTGNIHTLYLVNLCSGLDTILIHCFVVFVSYLWLVSESNFPQCIWSHLDDCMLILHHKASMAFLGMTILYYIHQQYKFVLKLYVIVS